MRQRIRIYIREQTEQFRVLIPDFPKVLFCKAIAVLHARQGSLARVVLRLVQLARVCVTGTCIDVVETLMISIVGLTSFVQSGCVLLIEMCSTASRRLLCRQEVVMRAQLSMVALPKLIQAKGALHRMLVTFWVKVSDVRDTKISDVLDKPITQFIYETID